MKSKKAKTVEEIAMAERERERLEGELAEAEDQVRLCLPGMLYFKCFLLSHFSS